MFEVKKKEERERLLMPTVVILLKYLNVSVWIERPL